MLFDELGMTFSLPYNFQPDFIDRVLIPFADITEEVYLSMYWQRAVDPKVLMIARGINRNPAILRQLKAMWTSSSWRADNCQPNRSGKKSNTI